MDIDVRREGRATASWRAARRSVGISRNILSGDTVRRNTGNAKAKDEGKCKRAGQVIQWRQNLTSQLMSTTWLFIFSRIKKTKTRGDNVC
jgi:hypothetical protein